MVATSDCVSGFAVRYIPFLRDVRIRTTMGFALLLISSFLVVAFLGKGESKFIALIMVISWLSAILLTDKYVHKYPQRYYTYLFATHIKAAIIMALLLGFLGWITGLTVAPYDVLWTSYIVFVIADYVLSLPRCMVIPGMSHKGNDPTNNIINSTNTQSISSECSDTDSSPIDTQAILDQIRSILDKQLVEFIENNLPDVQGDTGKVLICGNACRTTADQSQSELAGLFVSRVLINDVRRINEYFLSCASQIIIGGYFVCSYVPHEDVVSILAKSYPGFLFRLAYITHFVLHRALPKIPWINTLYFYFTKGINRTFSKVEIWGRLSYCGMSVIAESKENGETVIIAQKIALPSQNKRPSYYPVVALEKVGLDGEIIRLHKVRSMYPYSEFLQKRIFEDNGLAATGKFANDFRLTEYGEFIRKYWLDELPQIFDWLRGEIKLVGMRATSRHYLSLYPKELYDLYIQIKPGLIPPIFGESTNSFDKIVETELAYLNNYMKHPFRTDVELFLRTFKDIFFRGVRSK